MNVEFINPFLKSILNVLSTMAQVDAKPGKPGLKKESSSKGDVTGMIGIAGDQARGSLAISFTESAILDIASRMLGEPITEVNDEIADMVGEITNMVTGGAKVVLSEKGYKFKMAIPTTILGKNHTIKHSYKGPIILIPFETEAGSFFVEICFETDGTPN